MPSSFYKTGSLRQQALLLPARIEDSVGRDNAVRAIEAYVASIDLAELKFRHAVRVIGAGQPPYDPADLLKLYLYGYLNQIRSSRRLEREAGRNIELMWLLRGLQPGYRTIGQFRSDNVGALKQANRDFVMVLRELDLVGRELVAIDGAFFDGNASKASIVTRKRLDEQLAVVDREIAAVEREIEDYTAALDANDAAEAGEPDAKPRPNEDVAGKLAALLAKHRAVAADVATLEASGQTQLSRTDADARLLSKNGQSVAGYNVQIAVDDKHKLIVADEVVNDGNDTGQLHAMAQAACAAVGADTLQAVADTGYFNGETLKACEDSGIEAFVPEPRRGKRLEAAGRFGIEAFVYDAAADVYRCPAGKLLHAMGGGKLDQTGKLRICYASRRLVCSGCPKRHKCLSPKATRRVVERSRPDGAVLQLHPGAEHHRPRKAGRVVRRAGFFGCILPAGGDSGGGWAPPGRLSCRIERNEGDARRPAPIQQDRLEHRHLRHVNARKQFLLSLAAHSADRPRQTPRPPNPRRLHAAAPRPGRHRGVRPHQPASKALLPQMNADER